MSFTVEAADYHRNGIGGVGFYVAIVSDSEHGRMLVVDFDTEDYGHTAVVNVDQAAAGNVYMHPTGRLGTGGNAWRGDKLGDEYRDAIRAHKD